MLNSKRMSAVFACAFPLLVSCVSGMPGVEPSEIPPHLVKGRNGLGWDNPARFGPVPPTFQANGDIICRQDGAARAIGYHPDARDVDGKHLSGGGYFCAGVAANSNPAK